MSETADELKKQKEIYEAEFRKLVREEFKIAEMLEVARGGLHCNMIKTHVNKHELVEAKEYPNWDERLSWWKAIAQAGGMIKESEDGASGVDQLMDLVSKARSRMQE